MKFRNEKTLDLERSIDFTSKPTIGIVVKTAEELGISNMLGIYIPKLSLGMTNSDLDKETNINIYYSKIVNHENSNIGDSSAVSKKYFNIIGLNVPNVSIPAFGKYEKVFVHFVDSDIKSMYFSSETLANPGKRQGDIYRIGVLSENMTMKNTDVESSKENMYYMEFDSKNQSIIISHSTVNGEKYQYSILLDAKNGTLSLTDGKRFLNMNSAEDRVSLQNESDTFITFEGDTMKINAANIEINADSNITIKSKSYKEEFTNYESKAKTDKTEHDTIDFKAKSQKSNVDSYEMTNLASHKITTQVVDMQVIGLAVKGLVAATGLSMAPTPPTPSAMPSLPPGNSVSEMGHSDTKIGTSKINSSFNASPLVKGPELQQIITLICTEIDKALLAGSLPPTASATILPNLIKLLSTSVSAS